MFGALQNSGCHRTGTSNLSLCLATVMGWFRHDHINKASDSDMLARNGKAFSCTLLGAYRTHTRVDVGLDMPFALCSYLKARKGKLSCRLLLLSLGDGVDGRKSLTHVCIEICTQKSSANIRITTSHGPSRHSHGSTRRSHGSTRHTHRFGRYCRQ